MLPPKIKRILHSGLRNVIIMRSLFICKLHSSAHIGTPLETRKKAKNYSQKSQGAVFRRQNLTLAKTTRIRRKRKVFSEQETLSKPGTAKVGAIREAQKAQTFKNMLEKNSQKSFEALLKNPNGRTGALKRENI